MGREFAEFFENYSVKESQTEGFIFRVSFKA